MWVFYNLSDRMLVTGTQQDLASNWGSLVLEGGSRGARVSGTMEERVVARGSVLQRASAFGSVSQKTPPPLMPVYKRFSFSRKVCESVRYRFLLSN